MLTTVLSSLRHRTNSRHSHTNLVSWVCSVTQAMFKHSRIISSIYENIGTLDFVLSSEIFLCS